MDQHRLNYYKENPKNKAVNFLEDIWPSIYKIINSLLFGIWDFIKDTLSGLWRINQ